MPPSVNDGPRVEGQLAHGVRLHALPRFEDWRGSLAELFRAEWWPWPAPVQWNLVTSEAGVMRGVHVHVGYAEYYVLIRGRSLVGYQDVRSGSPTLGATAIVESRAEAPCAIMGPPGLAHAIYCSEASTLLVGTTATWDPATELGCHWRDPDLRIAWPFETARLSERDAALPPLSEILPRIPPFGSWP
jgi:dTDP-4-dehydrorhamnose 3,5-epimerase